MECSAFRLMVLRNGACIDRRHFRRHAPAEVIMPKRKKITTRKAAATKAASAKPRSKQDQLLALLRRAEGVTIEQAAKALAWQTRSVRGIISGVLKKRLGFTITSEKGDGGRVYRVGDAETRTRS